MYLNRKKINFYFFHQRHFHRVPKQEVVQGDDLYQMKNLNGKKIITKHEILINKSIYFLSMVFAKLKWTQLMIYQQSFEVCGAISKDHSKKETNTYQNRVL